MPFSIQRVFGLALCGLALPAAGSACPLAADLATGIRILFEDGVVIEYTVPSPGLVEEVELEPDGSRYHIITERGIFETASFSRPGGGKKVADRTRYEYDFETASVFPLDPGKTGGGKQLSFDDKGALLDEAFIGYGIGAPGTFSAGACTYASVPVQINMRYADSGPLVIRLAYLPELDFAVIQGYYEWSYEPTLYVPLSMEPM